MKWTGDRAGYDMRALCRLCRAPETVSETITITTWKRRAGHWWIFGHRKIVRKFDTAAEALEYFQQWRKDAGQ